MNLRSPASCILATLSLASSAQAEPPIQAEPAVSTSAKAETVPAEAPPPGTRGTLALTGGLVFAGWYGLAIAESYAYPKAPEASSLRIPVVGPWMTIAKAGCAPEESGCTTAIAVIRAVVAGVSAVAQVGGLAVVAEAALLPSARPKPPPPKASVAPMFSAGPNNVMLGVSGAF